MVTYGTNPGMGISINEGIPNSDDQDGSKKTLSDAIKEIAGIEIRDTYPNYSMIPTVVQNVRKFPVFGNFVAFMSEMYRNFANNRICQVDLADTYDHKHQDLSTDDENKGLSRMSIDIIKTFIKKLATQGHSFSREQLRSLKATYYRSALDLIDAYRGDAEMNGLKFDSHSEEKAVELFSKNIIKAGEDFYLNPMDAPFIPTWSRVKSCLLYTSPSPRDATLSRMPSSA